jgi:nucleoside-diphosphate-sugar epimerase
MKTFLITGTTGFLGSSLAASLLFRGHRVVSLSRNDSCGERTRKAIAEAAAGFNLGLGSAHWANLRLEACQYENLEKELANVDLDDIDEVWHCAAHMSYSPKKLDQALRQNLEITTELYELVSRRARACRRFVHVSTAYTAGIEGGAIPERLHPRPRLANSYQISKWSAEQALANLCREPNALPVTIFRPSVIVGHSLTGWSPGNRFGYFMFVHALKTAAELGIREASVDLSPEARPNLVPMDEVVGAAVALGERDGEHLPALEIFHAANPHQLTSAEHLRIMGERLGIRVRAGAPKTAFDQKINEAIAWNREFASRSFDFDVTRLRAAIGPSYCARPMTAERFARGVDVFVERAEREKAGVAMKTLAVSSLLRRFRGGLEKNQLGVGAAVPNGRAVGDR